MKKIFYILFFMLIDNTAYLNLAFADEHVVYNLKTNVYHKQNCRFAKKCTKNCVLREKTNLPGHSRPCKVCH